MELKEGYKQTEVGVIPEDWNTQQAREFSKPVRGGSPRPAGDPRYFNGSFIPWLTVAALTNIPDSQLTVEETASHLTEEGSHYSRILDQGTLIIANSGATLGVAKILGIKCCANDGIAALLNLDDTVSPQFLTYYFNTQTADLRDRVATGNGQPNLNTGLIGNIVFPLPPTKAEQEEIAEALSDADALIESLEQLIAKKRQIKQGTMQELLTGKKRLPGFSAEWEVKTFGEVFAYLPTATNSRSDLIEDGEAYYIHYGDIHTKFHNHLDFMATKPPMIDRTRCRNAALMKNGDWVMADASEDYDGVGKSIEILGLGVGQEAVSGLHTFLLREKKPTFVPGFKGHLGGLKSLHEEYLRVATGMKVFGVSKTALTDLKLPVPHPEEQSAITDILSDIDKEIAYLEIKLGKVRQIKQGMMQELLTGRTRLI